MDGDNLQIRNQHPIGCATRLHQYLKNMRGMLRKEDPNEFTEKFEIEEIRESFIQFGHLTMSEYEAAIKNAFVKEREECAANPDHFPRLDFPKVKKQLHSVSQASRDRANAHVNTLPPPNSNRQYCSPAEWLGHDVLQIWANFKAYGEMVVPPFWNLQVRGYHEGQELAILMNTLREHPSFTKDEELATCKEAVNLFRQEWGVSMLEQRIGVPISNLEGFSGTTRQLEALKTRIDDYNATKAINKFAFDPSASFRRAFALAHFKAYGRLVIDREPPRKPQILPKLTPLKEL